MKLPLTLLLVLLSAGHLLAREKQQRINLKTDGSYENLVFAIDRSSPENATLLEKIKEMMREFSAQLSIATKPLFKNGASLRIGQVFILLPKTWNNTDIDEASSWQTFENSDIRLGSSPGRPHYTHHGGNCTRIGSHVVFDTNHTLRTDAYWLGKQMVFEFGRYRWGLRSEHNGDEGPHHYYDNGTLVPALCTSGIRGAFRHNQTGLPCKVDRNSLELDPSCRFYPDLQQSATASLLAVGSVRSIEYFCDHWHTGPAEKRHNKRAPVPLNHFSCGSHSGAADLMKKSESGDFLRPPTMPQPIPPPPVQFTVVRPRPYRRLAIVTDVSGSMDGPPLNKIKTGMDSFIRSLLEDGIECALVTFNSIAKVLKPMGFLDTQEKREEYARASGSMAAGGSTAIGDGLAQGLQVLGIDVWKPRRDIPGYILLLTDGRENSATNFTLLQAAKVTRQTSIIVDTVTFGRQADKRLTQLSEDTNGLSFFTRFENYTNDFLEQLSQTVRTRVAPEMMPIDIFSAPITQRFSIPIQIDSTVGKDTSFLLATYRASDIASMDLKVTSPGGTVYDKNSPEYTKDRALGTIAISPSGQVQPGQWLVTDGSSTLRQPSWSNAEIVNTQASLIVSSKPASQEVPFVLDGSVIGPVEINLNRGSVIAVVASLSRAAQLMLGAKILAKVESESGVDAVLHLQDSGVFPDVEAGDGIYSAQIPLKNISRVQEYNIRLICEAPVSRVSSAGKIYVKSVDSGSLRNLPPASVQDLTAKVDLATHSAVLTFTAVGDEQNEGTAASYTIKASDNASTLEERFDLADDVLVGVKPLPAGSVMSVNISSSSMPSYNGTFYVAIRATSSNNVASAVSNVVATQLQLPDNIDSIEGGGEATTQTPEVATTTKAAGKGLQRCGSAALLSFALCLFAVRAA